MKKTATILTALLSTPAWAVLDDFDKLEDAYVLYAGEVEHVECPTWGKYDCAQWPLNLLKFKDKNVCFIPSSAFICGTLGCRGLLVKPKVGDAEFFAFSDRPLSNKAERAAIRAIKCPEMY